MEPKDLEQIVSEIEEANFDRKLINIRVDPDIYKQFIEAAKKLGYKYGDRMSHQAWDDAMVIFIRTKGIVPGEPS